MSQDGDPGPIIYVDRSVVHDGCWDDLRAGIRALVRFVESRQPQMIAYGFYLDEEAGTMTVVSVHPDSASLERHVQVGTPEFKKLAPFVDLREIEVFGRLSASAASLLQQKAAALGERGSVTMREHYAGFARVEMPARDGALRSRTGGG